MEIFVPVDGDAYNTTTTIDAMGVWHLSSTFGT